MSATENFQSESLAATTARLLEVQRERDQLEGEYRTAIRNKNHLIGALERRIAEINAGIDIGAAVLARQVLNVVGKFIPGEGEHNEVVHDAVAWFAAGHRASVFSDLGEGSYYGVKNYAHWRGQRSDHPLYSCPRHGSLVFRIGLRDHTKAVTPEQREACLYYLNNLAAIQATEPDE